MSSMIDLVSTTFPPPKTQSANTPLSLLPIFITCDPARDTPSVLKSYLQEFHPSMIGLTGAWEQIKNVCKLYRVYFSTPEGVKPGMDYLVDHSIYFYLMGERCTSSWKTAVHCPGHDGERQRVGQVFGSWLIRRHRSRRRFR